MKKRSNWLKNDREAEEAKRTMLMDAKMEVALEECEAKANLDLSSGTINKEAYDLLIKVVKKLRDLMKLPHSYDGGNEGDRAVQKIMDEALIEVDNMEKLKEHEEIGLAEE
jgi:hypothetical protein